MDSERARKGFALTAFVIALIASHASSAQAPHTVVWLDYGMPDQPGATREARAQALELELDARNYVLLEGTASSPGDSPEQASLSLLARSDASAVIWLGADPERPVSWLFVRAKGRGITKAPLTYPPEAIDPQLLAIAAASLLDQTLREPSAPQPVPVAERAPAAPPAFVKTARPVLGPRAAPEPPRLLFVQLGVLVGLAVVTAEMETTQHEPTTVNNVGVAPIGGLRLALGGWASQRFALVSFAEWHASIPAEDVGGNLSFGLDSQWLLTGAHTRGYALSAVAGLWIGRTETPVGDSGLDAKEHVLSGPFGARLGFASRYGFTPESALVLTPSFALRFPTGQLELGLAFAAEHAF